MSTQEEQTSVVTAFVYSGDKVLLMKRSRKVRAYPGKWAGISGYMEHLPIAQALMEIQEEAGLSPDDLTLKGIGIPTPVDDKHGRKNWLVFPFLFKAKANAQITPDWESVEHGWFEPEKIAEMDAVPGLADTLGRVWPAFGDREFWGGLQNVASDRVHGATHLARSALNTLGGYVQANESGMGARELVRCIQAFAACRPSMGVFPGLAARLLLATDRSPGAPGFDALITEMLSEIEDSTSLSARKAAEALKGSTRLFTLSSSEAVLKTIMEWQSAETLVTVAESDPGKEGLILAANLRNSGIQVDTVPDSQIEEAAAESEAVLVGCDGIFGDGQVQNKIGTRDAVDAARSAGVPAFAVTQTSKICPSDWPITLEFQDDPESPGTPMQVFDLTPISHFKAVITEEGALTPKRYAEIRTELDSVYLVSRQG